MTTNGFRHITLLDCFVHNKTLLEKLKNIIFNLKDKNEEIALITNTVITDEYILNNVDYFIFDKNNRLFNESNFNYPNHSITSFFKMGYEPFEIDITVNNIKIGSQKHGLSYLVNLNNSLIFLKNLGYTHFQRLEVDAILTEDNFSNFKNLRNECFEKNKKGLIYNCKDRDKSVVTYYFCEIDLFLNNTPRIFNENDYLNYLQNIQGNNNFLDVENFIFKFTQVSERDLLIKDDYTCNKIDFANAKWNTEISISDIDTKYSGNISNIYFLINHNNVQNEIFNYKYILTSYNLSGTVPFFRKIIVYDVNDNVQEINHFIREKNHFLINPIEYEVNKICVYENDILLYTDTPDKYKRYAIIEKTGVQ